MTSYFDPNPGWIPIIGVDHALYFTILLIVAAVLFGARGWIRAHARAVCVGVAVVSILQQCVLYGSYALAVG